MVLRAKEIMQTNPLVVDGTTPVREVTRQMLQARCGYALVAEGGAPVAIATEWDFVAKVVAAGRDPETTPVAAIASRPLVSLDEQTPTDELVRTMAERGIRRMPLTRGGRVVGLVAAKDVIAAFPRYVDQISSDIARLQTSAT